MKRPFDTRTFAILLAATLLGVAWAAYNLAIAGTVRDDSTLRPLVWVVFATPFALFAGWLLARRHELGLAAACCFSLYFFSFFVAQRIETIAVSPEQASASGHGFYFNTVIVLHVFMSIAIAIWRAVRPTIAAPEPATGQPAGD